MKCSPLRRATLLAVIGCLTLLGTACGDDDDEPGAEAPSGTESTGSTQTPRDDESGERPTIGFAIPILRGPPLQAEDQLLEAFADEAGYEYVSIDANYDVNKQVSDVDSLLQQGVDVLLTWPIDANALQPAFDRARDEGIPIIVQATSAGGPYFTNVAAEDHRSGEMAADYLAEVVGPDGQVAAILGPEFVEVLAERSRGFMERAEEIGLDIVETKTASTLTPEESSAFADELRQRHPDLDGIFTFSDASAQPVAARTGNGWTPAIVSIDAYPETLELIEQGLVTATFDPRPVDAAKAMAWAVEEALAGREVPDTLSIEYLLYDSDNVGEWVSWEDQIATPSTFEIEERDGKHYVVVR